MNNRLAPPVPTNALQVDPRSQLALMIGERTLRIFRQQYGNPPVGVPAFYADLRFPGRIVLVFNPNLVGCNGLSPAFIHRLTVNLQSRAVKQSKLHGRVCLQVAYWPESEQERPTAAQLASVPLDLDKQPSPLHIPIGMTKSGPLWLNIMEMDSVLIGGARRMGKTYTIHGWIQALQHGGKTDLYLWDGKNGGEFNRYAGHPFTVVATDLSEALQKINTAVFARQRAFALANVTNLPDYMALGKTDLRPIVMVLDELADLPPEAESAAITLVRRAGAYGVYPVIGIQRPDANVVNGQLRANLVTRIALHTSTPSESRIILGKSSNANRIPNIKGRMLFEWDGEWIEAQGFLVKLPANGQSNVAIPLITNVEKALVQYAIDAGGWFKVREIAEAAKADHLEIGRDAINDTARRWEAMGLLTTTQFDSLGRRLGRRITPALAQAAALAGGLVGQPDLSDLPDFAHNDPDFDDAEPD